MKIRKPIEKKETLLNASKDFYEKIARNENFTNTEKEGFLIRIGRHSGAEAVTIEGNRFIKISPPGRPFKPSREGSTTLWLASDEKTYFSKPSFQNLFGWAILTKIE